jgi:hypothetical protein
MKKPFGNSKWLFYLRNYVNALLLFNRWGSVFRNNWDWICNPTSHLPSAEPSLARRRRGTNLGILVVGIMVGAAFQPRFSFTGSADRGLKAAPTKFCKIAVIHYTGLPLRHSIFKLQSQYNFLRYL